MDSLANITSTVNNPLSGHPPVSDGQKHVFAAVGAVCLVLTYGATIMKVLTEQRSGEKTSAQNWTFRGAVVLFTAFVAAGIAMFASGEDHEVIAYANAAVASTSFYAASLVLVRIAVLCLYQNILFRETRYWRFSIVLGAGFTLYSFIYILVDALQCKPMSTGAHDSCISISGLEIAIGILDFLVNAIILAMPIRGMWQGRRHPDTRNHICYLIAFKLGLTACILSLAHAIAPATSSTTWSLLYPLTGVITLTLIFLAIAIIQIPTFIRCRAGPIQSPTATHPHLTNASRSASVLSWIPGHRNPKDESPARQALHDRNLSADTFPSVSDINADIEKTPVNSSPYADTASLVSPSKSAEAEPIDGRTNSLRSFTRLGSLSGAIKPPSFLNRNPQPPPEVTLAGIRIKTEVEMSWEARQKALSRRQSPNPPSS